jgi:phosphoglycolate phosphatase
LVKIHCGQLSYSNIQAILFDKDGTLAHSEDYLRSLAQRRARLVDAQVPGVQDPLEMAFGVEGTTLNPAGLQAVGSRRDNEIAAAAYIAETGCSWFAALEIVASAFEEAEKYLPEKATQTPLFEGGLACLKILATAGIRLGIVSGDCTENIDRFVAHSQLQDLIQLTWGADRTPAKPDPDCFRQACQALGVSPKSTLMIGDSTSDMAMARSAGAAGCIGVNWGWRSQFEIQQADGLLDRWEQIRVES